MPDYKLFVKRLVQTQATVLHNHVVDSMSSNERNQIVFFHETWGLPLQELLHVQECNLKTPLCGVFPSIPSHSFCFDFRKRTEGLKVIGLFAGNS